MRTCSFALLLFSAIGCGSNAASNLLCSACGQDADCGGNPCFTDGSGLRFCGSPCNDGCPPGFYCVPVTGTGGGVGQTCFPESAMCLAPTSGFADLGFVVPDLSRGSIQEMGTSSGADLSGRDLAVASRDLATAPCTPPMGGTVSAAGGTVDRLYFGYTGDTRPATASSGYSADLQMTINNIFKRMAQNGVSFALDGGDHMEASNASEAQANIASYVSAAKLLGKPVFMTMGNHECATSFTTDCGAAGAITSDFKLAAFMSGLKQTANETSPYYRFDVMTATGKAVFIVVADDAWNATQQAWLTQQLTDADAHAKYTFVSKHHPDGNTDQPAFQQIYDLVKTHKYTLFLTGHSHEYKHPFTDPRAVVMGLGGAPFDNPNQMWWGYLTVMQCPNDQIVVTAYDEQTGNVKDTFSVPPQ